jgi:hypothetical protein
MALATEARRIAPDLPYPLQLEGLSTDDPKEEGS